MGAVALLFVFGGTACVFSGRNIDDDAPTGYGITFYEPFDNSREWGPGYLAGPPPGTQHYNHDEDSGRYQHPLVHTDTNGTAPSIPDASRSRDKPEPDKPDAPASDSPTAASPESTTGVP
jgi:hypothetical protein